MNITLIERKNLMGKNAEREILEGDLFLFKGQIERYDFSPQIVFKTQEKEGQKGILLVDGRWLPARCIVLAEEGLAEMIGKMKSWIDFKQKELDQLHKSLDELLADEKDIKNQNISRECIVKGHLFKQGDDLISEGCGMYSPISVRKCTRPGCKKMKFIDPK